MFKNPFSIEGRIRRMEYGISIIIYYVAIVVSGVLIESIPTLGIVLMIPTFWFMIAQGTKRCHDLGHNGWWQLIPFYGLFMLFEDGQLDRNDYGVNPKKHKKEQEAVLDDKKYCHKCGELLDDDSRFCMQCGVRTLDRSSDLVANN